MLRELSSSQVKILDFLPKEILYRNPGDGENRDDKERPVSLKTSGEMMLGIGKKRWRYPWDGAVMLT